MVRAAIWLAIAVRMLVGGWEEAPRAVELLFGVLALAAIAYEARVGFRITLTPQGLEVAPLFAVAPLVWDVYRMAETAPGDVQSVSTRPMPWSLRWLGWIGYFPWWDGGPAFVLGSKGTTVVRIERRGKRPVTIGVRDAEAYLGVLRLFAERRTAGLEGFEPPRGPIVAA